MSGSNTSICPISTERVNENTVRLVALLVILTTSAGWFSGSWLAFLLLAADFSLRAFTTGSYSPLRQAAQWLTLKLSIGMKLTDAAPKKFAAGIGMVFAFAIAGSLFLQWTWTAGILSGVLLFCALLESALSYCVGCVVYALLQRFLLKAQA